MLNSTTAATEQAHRAAIKVQVHCKSLGLLNTMKKDVLLFFKTMHAVHRWSSSSSALSALLFLILMTSNCLKELLQTCCQLYCFELLFGGGSGVLCLTSLANPHEKRQKSLKFGLYIYKL